MSERHHHHHHHHWVFRHGHWIVLEEAVIGTTVVPRPCTCLTKSYTPDGLVVFADLCTKESASAPVAGSDAQAGEEPDTNDFAGRTYKDYLAANPQAAQVKTTPAIPQPTTPNAK